MNSEELEKSLRSEFETYLKDALADVRQDVFHFQYKIDSELENYKLQLDEVFKEFSDRLKKDKDIDNEFQETVITHLRLARDQGATIAAQANARAEELAEQQAPSIDIADLRDAINDISNQNSQATILRSLINHAEKFVSRGAFFVVKNDHFVGWRVFGKENPSGNDAISEIFFDVSAPTILGEAVNSLRTIESTYGQFSDDSIFLEKLGFGQPDRMFALPLIARGRGVAAIYADYGEEGDNMNVEALDTLLRVAGLTVELLAASQAANIKREPMPTHSYTTKSFIGNREEPVKTESTGSFQTFQAPAETYESTPDPEEYTEVVEEYTKSDAVEEETYQVSDAHPEDTDFDAAEDYEESYETAPAFDYEETVESASEEVEEDDDSQMFPTEIAEEYSVDDLQKEYSAEKLQEESAEFEIEETYTVDAESLDDDQTSGAVNLKDSSEVEDTSENLVDTSFETPETVEHSIVEEDAELEDQSFAEDFVSDDDLIEEFQSEETAEPVEFAVETGEETKFEAKEKEPQFEEVYAEIVEEHTAEPKQEETEASFVAEDEEVEDSEDYVTAESSEVYEFEAPSEEVSDFEEETEELEAEEYQFIAQEEEVLPAEDTDLTEQTEEFEEVEAQADSGVADVEEDSLEEEFVFESTSEQKATVVEQAPAEVVSKPVESVRTRFADRNVDLPIDVSEEERRLHNDARRFARLLVSEIKLYNEQKVIEGRSSGDIYDRLREAIDRSREMYDKRVQPPVAKRFDYFHYEVVNTLGDGEEAILGNNYPGATI